MDKTNTFALDEYLEMRLAVVENANMINMCYFTMISAKSKT